MPPFSGSAVPVHNHSDAVSGGSDLQPVSMPGFVPTGDIRQFANPVAPSSGWLPCDGAAVSRTTYAALFAVVATDFGPGDGSTTFNVPDMRGRSPIGVGTGGGLTARARGATIGVETHPLAAGENASHSHTPASGNNRFATNSTPGANTTTANVTTTAGSGSGGTATNDTLTSSGSGTAHQNMQPSEAGGTYFIKT